MVVDSQLDSMYDVIKIETEIPMITGMLILNVENEEGEWGSHYVPRDAISEYPEYATYIDEATFFFLACSYLEDICSVYSTDRAKIEYYDEVGDEG